MAKQPITYVKKSGPVYVDSRYYQAGEPFTTSETPGEDWERITPLEKAAADASDKTRHDDPPLEVLGIDALRAVAVTKKVNPDGLSKKDLITAIKAADEPAL